MKLYNKFILFLALVIATAGCSEFDDINTDPDAPITSTSSMLATGIILDILKKGGNKNYIYDVVLAKQYVWNEGVFDQQYNKLGRQSFSSHLILKDCEAIVTNSLPETKENYEALALFAKAYKLYYTSLDLGDIPYTDAGYGETGNVKPTYDTQKDVMLNVLKDLEDAYNKFSSVTAISGNSVLDGDVIFGGDRDNWKKVITAFQLKVLMNLCKKEADGDMDVKARFAKVFENGTLMESNADNFQLTYENRSGMQFPFNDQTSNQCKYALHSSVLIDMLKEFKDYRLFHYAEPSKAKTDEGVEEDDYDAYIGIDPSISFGDLSKAFGNNMCCITNLRYTSKQNTVGEPLIRLGYGEQQLILAEACLRGWIKGNPDTYYKEGIKTNMHFTRANTPEKYAHKRIITDEYIEEYLKGEEIQLNDSFEHDLEMIISQKYIASFLQYPYEAYYDYRRTGYPIFPINPETSMNATAPDKMPVRYMYSETEYSYNRENLVEALDRQFGGSDDINDVMWILK